MSRQSKGYKKHCQWMEKEYLDYVPLTLAMLNSDWFEMQVMSHEAIEFLFFLTH